MKKITQIISNNGDIDFGIKWRMTDSCNANCSYCIRSKTKHSPEDIDAENTAMEAVAEKINTLIERIPQKKVKLFALGGEVSILDLPTIFSKITSEKLQWVSITTNLLRDADFYLSLADVVPLSITASCHYESQTVDAYIAKIRALKESGKLKYLCCEMVSTENNAEEVNSFIEQCEELGVYYMVEPDRRKETDGERAESKLICKSNRETPVRYSVTFSDGSTKKYKTRTELLNEFTARETMYGRYIPTKGLCCSYSYDYAYILYDKMVGRRKGYDGCRNVMEIEDFEPIEAPEPCTSKMCTICGNMSLYDTNSTVETDEEYPFYTVNELAQIDADAGMTITEPIVTIGKVQSAITE